MFLTKALIGMSIFVGGPFGGVSYLVGRGFRGWFLTKALKSDGLSIFGLTKALIGMSIFER